MQGVVTSTGETVCSAAEMPSGSYALRAALADGNTLFGAATLAVQFSVASVSPSTGSMAGGTVLQITGAHLSWSITKLRRSCVKMCCAPPKCMTRHHADKASYAVSRHLQPLLHSPTHCSNRAGQGFSSDPAAHVVTMPVPRSSNYPNAELLCDVLTASATALTCRTRAHKPVNEGDSVIRGGPAPSAAGAVTVVNCRDAPQSDAMKFECWARNKQNRATAGCTGACAFAYRREDTATVNASSVTVGGAPGATVAGGDAVGVTGTGAISSWPDASMTERVRLCF